jgi:vacuolar-type H+-ATPase subunit H|uniref:ATPase n=1 Tax=Mesoaciditoga lauensis TaxID=1495039 RepID=A0A7V3VS27_9BACT
MEVERTVIELISSEKTARESIEQAKSKAQDILNAAKVEGKNSVKRKIDEANKDAKNIMDKAESDAQKYSQEVDVQTKHELDELKSVYSSTKDKFVSEFLSKFLESVTHN